VEHWPQCHERDGDAVGREEEERAQQFPGEIKLQKQVSWMHKEQAEP